MDCESVGGDEAEATLNVVGTEYRLTLTSPDGVRIRSVLSRLANASPGGDFEFRADSDRAGMPDATAAVEPYGLYFCDCGGSGSDDLGRLVAALVTDFTGVLVETLE